MQKPIALLIIDVQIGAFDGEKIKPLVFADQILQNIALLIQRSRSMEIPIFYIQDCGDPGGAFEKGSKHWPIHPRLKPSVADIVIEKRHGDAFQSTDLLKKLSQQKIEHLVICGLHSEHCVNATVLRALDSKFEVTVVSDGHSSIGSKDEVLKIILNQNQAFCEKGARALSTEKIIENLTHGNA